MHPLKAWLRANGEKSLSFAARLTAAGRHTSTAYLSHIITGHRRPSPELARQISDLTGGEITVEQLLFWKAEPESPAPTAESNASDGKAA